MEASASGTTTFHHEDRGTRYLIEIRKTSQFHGGILGHGPILGIPLSHGDERAILAAARDKQQKRKPEPERHFQVLASPNKSGPADLDTIPAP